MVVGNDRVHGSSVRMTIPHVNYIVQANTTNRARTERESGEMLRQTQHDNFIRVDLRSLDS